jgi:hypothetical protein
MSNTVSFSLEIDSANAAFGETDANARYEVARILYGIAQRIKEGSVTDQQGGMHDLNGNRVGEWHLSIETEDECDCGEMKDVEDERCDECQAIEDRDAEEQPDEHPRAEQDRIERAEEADEGGKKCAHGVSLYDNCAQCG